MLVFYSTFLLIATQKQNFIVESISSLDLEIG